MTSLKLEERIIRIEEKVDTLIVTVAAQTNVIANLVKFQSETEAVGDYKEKQSFSSRQKAGIYVSGILGISSILTAIILKLL